MTNQPEMKSAKKVRVKREEKAFWDMIRRKREKLGN